MTAQEVQHALTYSANSPFYIRSHIVVPNVYWGLGFNHELDLLSISIPAHIGTEIEIKVSKGDLKRDKEKHHNHEGELIRCLYFAGPIELQDAFFEYAPQEAGIITVYHNKKDICGYYQCSIRRNARPRRNFRPFTDKEIFKLLQLGNMRYWSLFSRQFKGGSVK